MSNEQIIQVLHDMRKDHELSYKEHEALAWAVAKIMRLIAGDSK